MNIMKKALIASAFFVSSLFFTSFYQPLLASECIPSGPSESVKVKYAVDGDTVKLVDGRSVRLIGVNTPELHANKNPEPGSIEAKLALKAWVEGKEVELIYGEEPKDRYNRVLGYLVQQGETLSQRLISEGLGWAISIPPNDAIAPCLFAAEEAPKTSGIGVWSAPEKRASEIRSGGFAVLIGNVTRINHSKKYTYIDLDRQLAVRVANNLVSELHVKLGDSVQVRGWVIDRRKSLKEGSKFSPFLLPLSDRHHFQIVK